MKEVKPTSNTNPQSPAHNLRLRRAQRDQVTPVPARLDALLPEDHLARLIRLVVICDEPRGDQCAGVGAPVRRTSGVHLAVRRGLHELPHVE